MISRTGMHSVRALAQLAALPPHRYLGASALARSIGAPQNYLGKLLQTMARDGLVVSRKGPGGGFRLAREPNRVTLLDILDPLEQFSSFEGCILGQPRCSSAAPCAIHHRWAELRDAYLGLLGRTTLSDLVMHATRSVKPASRKRKERP